jgi:SAM-dependent methyltransferase
MKIIVGYKKMYLISRSLKSILNAFRRSKLSYISSQKLSYNDLRSFGKKFATLENSLIIYIEFPYEDLLPNAHVLPHYEKDCERYFELLESIESCSYSSVIATGLLEHLKDPVRLLNECYRILIPGGKAYVSASSVFSVHRGPDDYFHVTQYGMKELVSSQPWKYVDIRGSCSPFKTIGILLQRILLQCETEAWIRPFVNLIAHLMPKLDKYIIAQYSDRSFRETSLIDSMLPSNIQLIATK